jgi:hypothetical protein
MANDRDELPTFLRVARSQWPDEVSSIDWLSEHLYQSCSGSTSYLFNAAN